MADAAHCSLPEPLWTGPLQYRLPAELIAQRPTPRREDARLMVVEREGGRIWHRRFSDLPEYVARGDAVVANDSRVLAARLVGRKASGGRVELLVLELARGISATTTTVLSRASKPLRSGQLLSFEDGIECAVLEVLNGGRCVLDFGETAVVDVLARVGRVPLPPYISRPDSPDADDVPSAEEDAERYQTVFAEREGSVAAPTAGLHLSDTTIASIRSRGAEFLTVTLHVGPGTFAPIRGKLEAHTMQSERCTIALETAARINQVRSGGGRIVAIGTTTVRTLESSASGDGNVTAFDGVTELFIRERSQFRSVDALVTNFHLPGTTLLCLVMAFAGEALVREAYERAVRECYRFYSYGDAMLIV